MVAIGEYELAVLKAVFHAGGTIPDPIDTLSVETEVPGDRSEALTKLTQAEYLTGATAGQQLTAIAIEYLEMLGLVD
ncbi:MAG: hypothetical protein CMH54_14580 [Myxococcales bacterium]|nr:hypothetical protein [Myxococcales bacterium]